MLTSKLEEASTEAQVAKEENKSPSRKRLTIKHLRHGRNVEEIKT